MQPNAPSHATSATMNADPCPISHSESRIFTTYPGSKYVIPSDEPEKRRLIGQHHMLKQAFDNKLVFPPISFAPGDEVLDSATGTGIYPLDLAMELPPSVNIYGVDIESRNFPPANVCPPNVHYSTSSLLDLPEEWTSKFVFVHQRLVLASAIPKINIPMALGQMNKVLKPGGWLQLLEAGDWVAGPVNETHKKLIRKFSGARGLDWHCYKSLPQLLTDAGFQNVTVVTRSTPNAGKEGEVSRNNLMALWRGIKVPILNNGGFGFVNSEQEMDKMLDNLEKEMRETEGAKVDWVVTYAQKPEYP